MNRIGTGLDRGEVLAKPQEAVLASFTADQRKPMLAALGAMKLAGLKLYGNWPADGAELRIMSEVYLGAIVRKGGEALLAYVPDACERLVDGARGSDREFPSAADFARTCRRIHKERHRIVTREMLAPDGRRVDAIAEVGHEATDAECSFALDLYAAAHGLKPIPIAAEPVDEVRARMHEMLGWEAPRA